MFGLCDSGYVSYCMLPVEFIDKRVSSNCILFLVSPNLTFNKIIEMSQQWRAQKQISHSRFEVYFRFNHFKYGHTIRVCVLFVSYRLSRFVIILFDIGQNVAL